MTHDNIGESYKTVALQDSNIHIFTYTKHVHMCRHRPHINAQIVLNYLKAQFNFSSGHPLLVTSIARRNSLKSMEPFLSVSNVLKASFKTCGWSCKNIHLNTWSQNSAAFPWGKHFEYIFIKLCVLSLPSGQSDMKPLYHSV